MQFLDEINKSRVSETKILTIRLPHELWVQLRRAQEDGYTPSIQAACVEGLEILLENRKKAIKNENTRTD